VTTDTGQVREIAKIIERYVTEHPRAADTVEGIRSWWIAREEPDASLEVVQQALDRLTQSGRLSRTTLPDGTAIYARAAPPDTPDGAAAGPPRRP